MPSFRNVAGMRFGRLVAQWPVGRRARSIYWLCVCDCGTLTIVRGSHLTRAAIKSCRCLGGDLARQKPNQLRHGHTRKGSWKTPTYASWQAMTERCANPKGTNWKDYGGRGITVCERWKKFENFLADMGERPEGKSIDRYPNNDGNYEIGNCRWATRSEQQRNRRPRSQWRTPEERAHSQVFNERIY